jgi:signal transduction histidine kinase/ActR/RegA family two-component response regulator
MQSMIKNKSLEHKILYEQVTMLFQSMVYLLLINLLICISLAFVFWGVVPNSSIILWTSLMLGMIIVRCIFYTLYKKQFTPQHLKRFSHALIIGSATAGVIWGMGGILLFSETQLEYQALLVFALMAMTGGSTFTLSIYMPTYFVFSPLTLLPLIIKLLSIGDKVHIGLAVITVIFLIALSLFNIKINRNFKRSLELRFENSELIEQLKEQKAEADRANNSKSKFLAAASHDLRQPLYSLSLFTSVLDESTKDPKTRKIIEQVNMSVDALKNLFDALLDISKLDAGAVEAKKTNVALKPLFEKLANAFNLQASGKNLMIHWPNVTSGVISEVNLLEQILRNYLENAIRYTERGSITVKCENQNDMVMISVCDTGIGISPKEIQDIFAEFYQSSNALRDKKKGLGLGLAIVDRTAKLLGHKISVTSEIGVGSIFSISVPQIEGDIAIEQPVKTKRVKHNKSDNQLIAVVDDDESILAGILQLLELWDYDVVGATSGTSLMAKLDQIGFQPDALITDYSLANNLTGLEIIEQLNSTYQEEIPALIVTGNTDKHKIEEMSAGKVQILYKPVATPKLRAFLRSIQTNK